ncbi:MAG: TonB-dependent receptor, partial [Vicingaceae bacterium]
MIKWILFVCFMGLSLFGFSQVVSVQDKETQEPLSFVSITDKSNNQTVVTNAAGKADISDFIGADEIVFRFLGYASKTLSFDQLKAINFNVQMEQSSINLNQVVVAANRWRQESANVPSKITSISPKEVALQNPQTAADLLNVSGKVFIQKSQQGGGSPMIRGFATNRLLYTVDGVRMNTAIFRGGNIQNVISLDPFAIENTEVFFGPGSVIYGSDAIGGVMSFQTLTPQLSLTDTPQVSGKAVARYSSANNEKTGHFDVNMGWKKWAFVSSFSSYDYDHLKMGANGPDDYLMPYYVKREDSTDVVVKNEDPELQRPSAYSQINLMQKVRFKPSEKWGFEYGFHYSETSAYGRYDRHNRMRDGLPRYGEWSYGPQKWMMNNLSISHHGKNSLYDELSIRIAQQSFEESRISRDLNDPNREIREEHVEAYSANFDFSKSIGSRHNLFYGVEAVYNDVNSSGTDENIESGVKVPGASRYPQANWASYGIYLNDQFSLSEKVMLQAGLRYNQYQINADFDTTFYPFPFTEAKIDNGALSGSFGAVYRPTDDWVIRANLATAFRSHNVDDIGKVFDSEPGAVDVPN